MSLTPSSSRCANGSTPVPSDLTLTQTLTQTLAKPWPCIRLEPAFWLDPDQHVRKWWGFVQRTAQRAPELRHLSMYIRQSPTSHDVASLKRFEAMIGSPNSV